MTAHRRTFRFREYSIVPDTGPGAGSWEFAVACGGCGERGPEEASSDDAFAWALAHLKAYPHHLSYREHITRPYRAVPGEWL